MDDWPRECGVEGRGNVGLNEEEEDLFEETKERQLQRTREWVARPGNVPPRAESQRMSILLYSPVDTSKSAI